LNFIDNFLSFIITSFAPPLKTITTEELQAINRAILLRYGMDFSNYEPQSLKRRMGRALQKFEIESVFDLWKIILKDNEFIFKLIDEITVGLTELFRNPTLWTFLREEFDTKYASAPSLNIWHAGCSTGEEVYTMSIVLYEIGLLPKAKLWATDLSGQAIRTAEEGTFAEEMFASYSKNYQNYAPDKDLKQYFYKQSEQHWQVFKIFKNNISFETHNLAKDEVIGKFDVIFCRNVMIYFDETLKMKVLEKFYHVLADDGYFIIGYYDALPDGYENLFEGFDSANKIFKKRNNLP
jgi:chemotaxis protein methyltransferase CheR